MWSTDKGKGLLFSAQDWKEWLGSEGDKRSVCWTLGNVRSGVMTFQEIQQGGLRLGRRQFGAPHRASPVSSGFEMRVLWARRWLRSGLSCREVG